jgi:nitroreductase
MCAIVLVMDAFEAIKNRRSIRRYLDKPLPRDLIFQVVDAGRLAPNAGNLQNWKFIVVFDGNRKKNIAEACMQQYWMEKASVHIVIVSEPDISKRYYGLRGERLYSTQNCAAAATNMLIAASALGLGACWVGAFDEDLVKKAASIPPEYRPQIIVTLGYPDEKPKSPAKHPLEIVAYINSWRGRLEDADEYFGFYGEKIKAALQGTKKLIDKGVKKLSDKLKED